MSHRPTTSPPAAAPAGQDRPGVDDLGVGEPALLMIPGWCGPRRVFDPLAGPLAGRRRVLVADLRGHGDLAGEPDDLAELGTDRQVDHLAALVAAHGVTRVVPVALSHAGWMAVELRRRLGADRVPGLVLVDWMPLGTPPGFADALAGLQDATAWSGVRAALLERWRGGVASEELAGYLDAMAGYGFEHWRHAAGEIAAGFAAHGTPLDAVRALGGCPTLHLYGQPGDDEYLAAQRRAAEAAPWFRPYRLDARSHFPMLEVPDAMVRQVEEFVCSLE